MHGSDHDASSVPVETRRTETLPGAADAPTGPPARRRFSRLPTIVLSVAALVVIAALISSFIELPLYTIVPGSALDVGKLISVPGHSGTHRGAVLLTDVDLVSLRAIDYLYYRLDGNAEIVGKGEINGSATSAQYEEQGVIDMSNARQAATVVALQALDVPVRAVPTGVIAYGLLPGSPASRKLSVGQVITAVNGHATLTPDALHGVIDQLAPGATVVISAHTVASSHTTNSRLRLGEITTVDSVPSCTVATHQTRPQHALGCIGISTEEQFRTEGAPFPVKIDSEGIVGPSAGLAFSLGLIDKLDNGTLTDGRRVAATGTMSVDGSVGDVGGVAQKTIAVKSAGATIFFVPPQELKVARSKAGSGLKVYAVANLKQALSILARLGGKITPLSNKT